MKISELFHIQKQLDDKILKEHGLTECNLLQSKTLALLVELGELANETRCFKYWSKKGPSSKEIVLEEYVDCLHFILSIGLHEGYTNVVPQQKGSELEKTALFLDIYYKTNQLQENSSVYKYIELFEAFLALGEKLGFSWEEIYIAYLSKNEVNHQRQANGY